MTRQSAPQPLRPDLLEEAGIEDFDQWAATFGETVSAIEVAPDGSGFRLKARFAKFTNVPELLRIFHVFGDVKTAEDLKLPTPALAPRRWATRPVWRSSPGSARRDRCPSPG